MCLGWLWLQAFGYGELQHKNSFIISACVSFHFCVLFYFMLHYYFNLNTDINVKAIFFSLFYEFCILNDWSMEMAWHYFIASSLLPVFLPISFFSYPWRLLSLLFVPFFLLPPSVTIPFSSFHYFNCSPSFFLYRFLLLFASSSTSSLLYFLFSIILFFLHHNFF